MENKKLTSAKGSAASNATSSTATCSKGIDGDGDGFDCNGFDGFETRRLQVRRRSTLTAIKKKNTDCEGDEERSVRERRRTPIGSESCEQSKGKERRESHEQSKGKKSTAG